MPCKSRSCCSSALSEAIIPSASRSCAAANVVDDARLPSRCQNFNVTLRGFPDFAPLRITNFGKRSEKNQDRLILVNYCGDGVGETFFPLPLPSPPCCCPPCC